MHTMWPTFSVENCHNRCVLAIRCISRGTTGSRHADVTQPRRLKANVCTPTICSSALIPVVRLKSHKSAQKAGILWGKNADARAPAVLPQHHKHHRVLDAIHQKQLHMGHICMHGRSNCTCRCRPPASKAGTRMQERICDSVQTTPRSCALNGAVLCAQGHATPPQPPPPSARQRCPHTHPPSAWRAPPRRW